MASQQTALFDLEKFAIRTPELPTVEEGRYPIKKASFISASALEEIKELLRGRLVQTKPWGIEEITDKDLNGLIDEIGTEWTTKQGNWPKRFAKVIKNRRGQKFNSDFLSVVGKIARESCVEHTGRDLIITKQFDWIPGTYGDGDSCFWGCREGAKIILQNNGGMALLIHGPDDEPLARAWCVPYGSSYIVFNCYTVERCSITIVTFARAMSDIFNFAYYRNIELTCRGVNCGPLWINHSDGAQGRAYIMGPQIISTVEKVDLDYEPLYCSNCDAECDREAYLDSYGSILCRQCKEFTNYCYSCGRRIHDDDTCTVGDEILCPSCYEREAFNCYACGEDHWKTEGISINKHLCCEDCVDRYYEECSACFKLVWKGDLCEIDGNDKGYCEDCWEEHTFECRKCGLRFDRRDEHEGHESGLCNNCFEQRCAHEQNPKDSGR